MILQFNTYIPCPTCTTETLVENIEFEDRTDKWRSWGYLCTSCHKKYKLTQFKESHEKFRQKMTAFLEKNYFIVLVRDLNFNEVCHHGSITSSDVSLFRKGTIFARSYYDDNAMRVTDPEVAIKSFAHGPKYILRGKNKKSVPKINPAFSFPRGFSMQQIKHYPLRRQGKHGSVYFHEHELRQKESLAAMLYPFDHQKVWLNQLERYYIPLYLGKVFGRRKPTPKPKK